MGSDCDTVMSNMNTSSDIVLSGNKQKGICKILIILFLIAVLIEVFVFNIQYITSSGNKEVILGEQDIEIVSEYKVDEDGAYHITTDENDSASVVISCSKLDNITISAIRSRDHFYMVSREGTEKIESKENGIGLKIFGIKKNADEYVSDLLYEGVVNGKGSKTYNVSKNYEYYVCTFSNSLASDIILAPIVVNTSVNLDISVVRLLIVYLWLILGFYFIRGNTRVIKLKQTYVICGLIAGVLLCGIAFLYPSTRNCNSTLNSYGYLAEAFSKGHTYVFEERTDELMELAALDNPYDYNERLEKGTKHLVDYAYYNGHYYVYFGVVPCLLVYLPWYLITGQYALNSVVMAVMGIFIATAAALLLYYIVERYFQKASAFTIAVGYILLIFGMLLPYMLSCSSVYIIAQASGLLFALLGLGQLIKAGNSMTEKNRSLRFAFGILFYSLAIGCRPQFGISVIIAIPFVYEYVMDKNVSLKKKLLALLVPSVSIGLPLMIYNYVRFGSVFDFGAYYNLTNDNIYPVTYNWDKTIAGIKYMFIDPIKHIKSYPFMKFEAPDYVIDRQVFRTVGGYFALFMVMVCALIPMRTKGDIRIKELNISRLIMIVFSIMVVILDVSSSGLIERYKVDFGIWIALSTCLYIIYISGKNKWIRAIIYIAVSLCIIRSFLLINYSDVGVLSVTDTEIFYSLSDFFAFWQ